ncbi:MAG: glutaredoxin [Bacteroidota bacterium]
MKVHPNEIIIYYHRNSNMDKKTVAYAQSITRHVRSMPFDGSPATTTMWRSIIMKLGLHPKEMLNKAHPYYQENIRGREFEDEDWLNVLARNPSLFKAAIAMKGKQAILCTNPTDVYRLA